MRVVVIGVGHVGLVTAATLAHIGHDVVGLDEDERKLAILRSGKVPFYEPGLQELCDEVTSSGKLTFTDHPSDAMPGADIAFICVGTPARPDGEANLLAVESAARSAAENATGDLVIVQKSTVPVRTADRIKPMFARMSSYSFHLVSNPEFLREGTAVQDSLGPDRILVGADDPEGHEAMRRLYAPFIEKGVTYHAVDIRTAELAKHACNAFLALKISYANALARICEASGADVDLVAEIMGSDQRIGRAFLDAGLGYGGYCFPKDVAAFKAQAERLGYEFGLLGEVMKINDEARSAAFEKIKEALWNLEGKRVLMCGLSFKPGTDDVRESPAIYLARDLIAAGTTVIGHDPRANSAAMVELPELEVVDDLYAGAEGADCIVIATEWPDFKDLDLVRLKGILKNPVIIDARNLLDAEAVANAGFTYIPTGKPPVNL